MEPKIKMELPFTLRRCRRCGQEYGPHEFIRTNSPFFSQGYSDLCAHCLEDFLKQNQFNWKSVDKLCQYLDIPFIPKEFERLHNEFGDSCFTRYAEFFAQVEYEGLNWEDYFREFTKLKEAGYIQDELPLLQESRRTELKQKWGFNYDDEALFYLESLYDGMLMTQNISGALQMDQALKLCKISYQLDSKIRAGEDIDKLIASYDKLVKTAEFTPKNVKNASDFDSVGELIKWLEKRGFKNDFYDNVTRDIVDETISNIQAYNRRLYTNESDIGEQINERLEGLKSAEQLDSYYEIDQERDLDQYEVDGYDALMGDNDDFLIELEEEDDNAVY